MIAKPSARFVAKCRTRVLKLLESGKQVKEVAKIIGVTERGIRYWQEESRNPKDKSAIRPSGHPRQLTADQLKLLGQELLKGSYEQGYAEDYWKLDCPIDLGQVQSSVLSQFSLAYHETYWLEQPATSASGTTAK